MRESASFIKGGTNQNYNWAAVAVRVDGLGFEGFLGFGFVGATSGIAATANGQQVDVSEEISLH